MTFPLKRQCYILITTLFFKLLIVNREAEHVVMEKSFKAEEIMSLLFGNKINRIIKLDLCIIQVIPNITWSFLATHKKRGLQLYWKTFSFYFSLCVFAVHANVPY